MATNFDAADGDGESCDVGLSFGGDRPGGEECVKRNLRAPLGQTGAAPADAGDAPAPDDHDAACLQTAATANGAISVRRRGLTPIYTLFSL